jgi:hypothetical protein
MYLGRGGFDADKLATSYQELKLDFETPKDVVAQLMGKPALNDYLLDGLATLKRQKIKVDNLPVGSVKSAKPRKP